MMAADVIRKYNFYPRPPRGGRQAIIDAYTLTLIEGGLL